ncbi:MAG: type I secretion C-terminal target domain-containing protein, partial [Thalassolituus oleivorans]|nr:type I secretion C-terminal target domain-containing protein [Thalassolituus oleivorans]
DDQLATLANGLVTLTASATITDGDGDSATDSESIDLGGNVRFADDGPSFYAVNDGDGDNVVTVIAPNVVTDTTYDVQLADWTYGADGPGAGVPTLSNVTGNVSIQSSTTDSVVLELKDADGDVVAELTLNADGTDSLEVFAREPELVTDILLTGDVTASGPELSKTINSSIGTLVVTVTGSDGNGTPGETTDEVNPSTPGWAVDNNVIDEGESIKFAFSDDVQRFSFVANGFTGSPSGGTVGLIITIVYGDGNTEIFTAINASSGQVIEVTDLTGFGSILGDMSIQSVQVESDIDVQDHNDGFRLNNVTVSQISTEPVPDQDYSFDLDGIVDGDGDSTSLGFDIHIDGDTGGDLVVEAITGTGGADTLTSTVADDVFIGDAGADTFVWEFGDTGTDTVADFNVVEGDVLDLSSLLDGEAAIGDLDNFLNFSLNGDGDTVIAVDADGLGGGTDQTIVLEGVDLVSGGGSQDDIINTLLPNLETDAV